MVFMSLITKSVPPICTKSVPLGKSKVSQYTCHERMPHRPPTPLTGLQHAWFFSVHLNNASVLVNVVETVPAMQWAS
jgi:hypothetical protein